MPPCLFGIERMHTDTHYATIIVPPPSCPHFWGQAAQSIGDRSAPQAQRHEKRQVCRFPDGRTLPGKRRSRRFTTKSERCVDSPNASAATKNFGGLKNGEDFLALTLSHETGGMANRLSANHRGGMPPHQSISLRTFKPKTCGGNPLSWRQKYLTNTVEVCIGETYRTEIGADSLRKRFSFEFIKTPDHALEPFKVFGVIDSCTPCRYLIV